MLSVDRPSTECRPITDRYIGQVSTNYRPTIGEVSAKCRRSIGEVTVNEKLYRPRHIWNDYWPCLDRVSTHYRPTIDLLSTAMSTDCRPSIDRVSNEYRPSVDRLSTDCRPSIDRLSTECRPLYRPLYRPISRSTLPTVKNVCRSQAVTTGAWPHKALWNQQRLEHCQHSFRIVKQLPFHFAPQQLQE